MPNPETSEPIKLEPLGQTVTKQGKKIGRDAGTISEMRDGTFNFVTPKSKKSSK